MLKGIMHPDDARLPVDIGATARSRCRSTTAALAAPRPPVELAAGDQDGVADVVDTSTGNSA